VRWLPKHAALVNSITASGPHESEPTVAGVIRWEYLEVAQQLLQQGLQASAWFHVAGGTASAAAQDVTAAVQGNHCSSSALTKEHNHQQQQLHLASFHSDFLGTPGVLAALPAKHLTSLNVHYSADTVAAAHAMTAALAQLTSLQQLCLTTGNFNLGMPDSCLSGVAQLPRLTKLTLAGDWPDMALQEVVTAALPLQHLDLGEIQSGVFQDSREPVLEMRGLSQLRELTAWEVPGECLLPAQLRRLTLISVPHAGSLSAIMALHQLQQLSLGLDPCKDAAALLRLGQLPALTHLALAYLEADTAAATATAWPQLSQLRELRVEYMDEADSEEQAAILAAVSKCTGLTKLQLQVEGDIWHGEEFVGIAACGKLAGLTGLQDLSIPGSYGALAPGDAQALSTLTGLTRLVLEGAELGVDDVAATALACCLRQLRHLDLSGCEMGEMACLAAIGQLAKLTALRLGSHHTAVLTERGLKLLTGLSRLRYLDILGDAAVSREALEQFWPACPLRAFQD
jgi:hypothetical protein